MGLQLDTRRWDVVIYECSTRKIESFAGRNMPTQGFYNAEKRVDTVAGRLNDDYCVTAVEAGKYKVGDTLEA